MIDHDTFVKLPGAASVFGPEYPKINTVFKRDMADGGVIIPDQFSSEEFEYLLDTEWTWTEKVDGTNIRLHFNGDSVTAGGRTDAAQTPGHLIYTLAQFNNPTKWLEVFAPGEPSTDSHLQPIDVTVYGEGYGPKIQNGGRYSLDVRFIVFDVRVGRWWLKREDVIDVAARLGMAIVPVVAKCSLRQAIDLIQRMPPADDPVLNFQSRVASVEKFTMEGIVGTPSVPLFDRRGQRIIAKLKVKDFEALVKRESRRGIQLLHETAGAIA